MTTNNHFRNYGKLDNLKHFLYIFIHKASVQVSFVIFVPLSKKDWSDKLVWYNILNKKIKLPTKGYNIGFDLKHNSLGLPGSAIFSGKWMPGKSYIEIENGLDTSDFTIMAWIYLRADEMKSESTLFDFRSESDDSLLHMVLLDGRIQLDIPAENKTIVLHSPGNKRTYHISTGWT